MPTSSPSSAERIDVGDVGDPGASRPGTGDPTGGLDLASLLGGGGADLKALTSDPQELVRRWLDQRTAAAQEQAERAAAAEVEEEELQEIEALRAAQQREEHQARLRELRDLVRNLYDEVEQLRARNDRLAAALGACHICFGTDPACEECTGAGGPGASRPDAGLFRLLVLPAARRLRESTVNGPTSSLSAAAEEAPRPSIFD